MAVRTPEGIARRKETLAKNRADRKQWMIAQKDKPCHDCGGKFPSYCMDFDHRPGETKLIHIGKDSHTAALPKLEAELKKCDLVCSNCHRIRTYTRLGY